MPRDAIARERRKIIAAGFEGGAAGGKIGGA